MIAVVNLDLFVRGWLVFNGGWHNVVSGSQMVFYNNDRDIEVYEYLFKNGEIQLVSSKMFCQGKKVPIDLYVAHVELPVMLKFTADNLRNEVCTAVRNWNNRENIDKPSRN